MALTEYEPPPREPSGWHAHLLRVADRKGLLVFCKSDFSLPKR
jgi:hypothetical protein